MEEMLENQDGCRERKKLKLETDDKKKTCAHWLKRKKRFCKMTVAKVGREFCGEHEPIKPPESSPSEMPTDRIPCPLDSKHTVYRKSLQKHLKICNARPKEEPSYVRSGINAGDAEIVNCNDDDDDDDDFRLNELSEAEQREIIAKIEGIYAKFIDGQIETSLAHSSCLDDELSKDEYGKESRKHLAQAASLLGILEDEQQLQNETSFIEFGAGKGQLAFYLARLLKKQENSQVILLDRMSLRHKKDNKIDDRSLVQRIRVDIADFYMAGLDNLSKSKRLVAISKHLCGAATDLTLRCITQLDSKKSVDFVMIALCCHHRCDWKSFVGKEFLMSHNITPREFIILTKMVSWAICGTGMSRERRRELEHNEQIHIAKEPKDDNQKFLSQAERERIGFMCKRVIDYARLDFLKKQGFDGKLKFYVPKEITLENVCLVANKM